MYADIFDDIFVAFSDKIFWGDVYAWVLIIVRNIIEDDNKLISRQDERQYLEGVYFL